MRICAWLLALGAASWVVATLPWRKERRHDPNELAKLKVVGLQANAAAARKWYDRAAELGAAEAGDRLRRLGAR